jgi:hypothetical protein
MNAVWKIKLESCLKRAPEYWRELSLLLVFYVFGFFLPWWMALIPALIAGGVEEPSPSRRLGPLRIALIGATSWVSVAFFQDLMTLGRLSMRIAAVMHLPTFLIAYVVTGGLAALLMGLAGKLGALIRLGAEEQRRAESQAKSK